MQNTISNDAKYLMLNMYICVPYGRILIFVKYFFLHKNIDHFILYLLSFISNICNKIVKYLMQSNVRICTYVFHFAKCYEHLSVRSKMAHLPLRNRRPSGL